MATSLDGPGRKKLRDILLDAFTLTQFDMLLADALDLSRQKITTNNGLEAIVFDVVEELKRDDRLPELVEAARKLRPRNTKLYQFSQQYFGLGITVSKEAFERLVVKTSQYLDPVLLRERLAVVERQVARISYPTNEGTVYGTGFLIGPSALMTNYHVIKPIREKKGSRYDVTVQFDYKRLPNGKVDEGRVVGLTDDQDWIIDESPYSEADRVAGPATLPTADELDYAILRLDTPVGDEPIGKTSDPDAPLRGFLDLAQAATAAPRPGTSVFIVQHPKGDPLALAMETQGMLVGNDNQTRLRYQTNTEGGSSGAPVFNERWTLIALHHAGDPDYSEFHHPEYNQGVPIHLIVERLKKNGKFASLSTHES